MSKVACSSCRRSSSDPKNDGYGYCPDCKCEIYCSKECQIRSMETGHSFFCVSEGRTPFISGNGRKRTVSEMGMLSERSELEDADAIVAYVNEYTAKKRKILLENLATVNENIDNLVSEIWKLSELINVIHGNENAKTDIKLQAQMIELSNQQTARSIELLKIFIWSEFVQSEELELGEEVMDLIQDLEAEIFNYWGDVVLDKPKPYEFYDHRDYLRNVGTASYRILYIMHKAGLLRNDILISDPTDYDLARFVVSDFLANRFDPYVQGNYDLLEHKYWRTVNRGKPTILTEGFEIGAGKTVVYDEANIIDGIDLNVGKLTEENVNDPKFTFEMLQKAREIRNLRFKPLPKTKKARDAWKGDLINNLDPGKPNTMFEAVPPPEKEPDSPAPKGKGKAEKIPQPRPKSPTDDRPKPLAKEKESIAEEQLPKVLIANDVTISASTKALAETYATALTKMLESHIPSVPDDATEEERKKIKKTIDDIKTTRLEEIKENIEKQIEELAGHFYKLAPDGTDHTIVEDEIAREFILGSLSKIIEEYKKNYTGLKDLESNIPLGSGIWENIFDNVLQLMHLLETSAQIFMHTTDQKIKNEVREYVKSRDIEIENEAGEKITVQDTKDYIERYDDLLKESQKIIDEYSNDASEAVTYANRTDIERASDLYAPPVNSTKPANKLFMSRDQKVAVFNSHCSAVLSGLSTLMQDERFKNDPLIKDEYRIMNQTVSALKEQQMRFDKLKESGSYNITIFNDIMKKTFDILKKSGLRSEEMKNKNPNAVWIFNEVRNIDTFQEFLKKAAKWGQSVTDLREKSGITKLASKPLSTLRHMTEDELLVDKKRNPLYNRLKDIEKVRELTVTKSGETPKLKFEGMDEEYTKAKELPEKLLAHEMTEQAKSADVGLMIAKHSLISNGAMNKNMVFFTTESMRWFSERSEATRAAIMVLIAAGGSTVSNAILETLVDNITPDHVASFGKASIFMASQVALQTFFSTMATRAHNEKRKKVVDEAIKKIGEDKKITYDDICATGTDEAKINYARDLLKELKVRTDKILEPTGWDIATVASPMIVSSVAAAWYFGPLLFGSVQATATASTAAPATATAAATGEAAVAITSGGWLPSLSTVLSGASKIIPGSTIVLNLAAAYSAWKNRDKYSKAGVTYVNAVRHEMIKLMNNERQLNSRFINLAVAVAGYQVTTARGLTRTGQMLTRAVTVLLRSLPPNYKTQWKSYGKFGKRSMYWEKFLARGIGLTFSGLLAYMVTDVVVESEESGNWDYYGLSRLGPFVYWYTTIMMEASGQIVDRLNTAKTKTERQRIVAKIDNPKSVKKIVDSTFETISSISPVRNEQKLTEFINQITQSLLSQKKEMINSNRAFLNVVHKRIQSFEEMGLDMTKVYNLFRNSKEYAFIWEKKKQKRKEKLF